MNADLSRLTADGKKLGAWGVLNVVLACEDFSAGMHALQSFDRLFSPQNMGNPGGAHSVWKFDLLEVTTLRAIAAEEAAAADLVILAMHGGGTLTAKVEDWLSMWVECRDHRPGALVLLMDDTGSDAFREFPAEATLKECATRAGMGFFAHKSAGRLAFRDHETLAASGSMAHTFADLREELFGGLPPRNESFGNAQPSFEA